MLRRDVNSRSWASRESDRVVDVEERDRVRRRRCWNSRRSCLCLAGRDLPEGAEEMDLAWLRREESVFLGSSGSASCASEEICFVPSSSLSLPSSFNSASSVDLFAFALVSVALSSELLGAPVA